MTSSNETSRSSRINTYIASVLCVIALAAVVLLFMVVRSLDAEFGDVRRNLPSMEREITTLGERRDQLVSTVKGFEDRQFVLRGLVADLEADAARVDGLRKEVLELESRKSAAESGLRDLEEIEAQIATANGTLIDVETDIASLKTQKSSLADEVSNLGGNRGELSDTVDALRSQRDALQADERRLRGEVAGLDQQRAEVNALTEQAASLNAQVDELKPRAQEATEQLMALRGKIVAEQSTLDGLKTKVAGLRSSEEILLASQAKLTAEKQSLDAKIAATRTELDPLQEKLSASQTAESDLATKLATLRTETTQVTSNLAAAQKDQDAVQKDVDAARNELASLNAEIAARDVVRNALADLEQRLADVKASFLAKSKERTALTETLAGLRAELPTAIAELENSRSQLAEVSAQRTNAKIKHDEAILATRTAEETGLELKQSIEAKTQTLDRLQADLRKVRMELATETEALATARIARDGLSNTPTANSAQPDIPEGDRN